MGERRMITRQPKFTFLLPETLEIVMPRELDRRAHRRGRLHDHLAFQISPARPAGDLRQQLKGSLRRAEIIHVQ